MKSATKKIATLLCCLALLLCLTGCERADYVAAVEVYNSGQFAEARNLFLALGEYEDSAALAKRCDYHLAVQLYKDGKFPEAIAALEKLGDYEDCQELITHSNYQIALQLKETRDYDAAQAAFEALEGYENSAKHISDIRWARMADALIAAEGLQKDSTRISIDPADPYTLTFYTERTQDEGYILFDTLTLTLRYESTQAEYIASNKFSLSWLDEKYGSTQTCSGILPLADLTAETVLPVENYRKQIVNLQDEEYTVTDPEGNTMEEGMALNLQTLLADVPGMLQDLDPRFTMDILGLSQLA